MGTPYLTPPLNQRTQEVEPDIGSLGDTPTEDYAMNERVSNGPRKRVVLVSQRSATFQPQPSNPLIPARSASIGSALFVGAVLLIAVVFVTAAIGKSTRFAEFEASLIASRLVPLNLVSVFGATIVALEFVLAAGLIASFRVRELRRPLFGTSALLVSAFLSYTLWRQIHGIQVPCHCFGFLFTLAPWQAVGINVALLSVLTAIMVRENQALNMHLS